MDDVFDPEHRRALLELRRVLKPGGTLHFLERGLVPDENVAQWQRRLEPVQKQLVGGCHLTRRIVPLLKDAGFDIIEIDHFYEDGSPKVTAADSLGVAISPSRRPRSEMRHGTRIAADR